MDALPRLMVPLLRFDGVADALNVRHEVRVGQKRQRVPRDVLQAFVHLPIDRWQRADRRGIDASGVQMAEGEMKRER